MMTSAARDDREQGDSAKSKVIGIIIFNDFETLDVFGPVQMWGRLPSHRLIFISPDGRPARSAQGAVIEANHSFENAPQLDVLMVPGGMGTRKLANDPALLAFVRKQHQQTSWTTSVCTGAAILARAGVLDGRRATTNKVAFDWVAGQSEKVCWIGSARWVIDGKLITSSGVSAGTDMALSLVTELYGQEAAEEAAAVAEYRWNDDPDNDPFAVTTKYSPPR
ncbi:DJ-1/PfpI family protein [Phyllobacterium ifriqiyense]|uniref:DJ-1/PfpI family protein n=1 Tax=Phyllobacterium ifriqiyense TaxID=314238 RepID=UPI0033935068